MKRILLVSTLSLFSILAAISQPALVEVITTDVSCNGFSDGTVFIRITGGQAPYSYTIFRGSDFYVSPSVNDTFYTFTNVEAKSWHVLLEDANADGDSYFNVAVVNEPSPISITSEIIVPISCTGADDGEIQITATGESGNYNFELDPGNVNQADGTFSPLSTGTYTVTVTDATGCATSDVSSPLELTDPPLISIATESSTDASCFGADDGIVEVTASGGTPPYSYTLNPGATQTNGTGSFSGLSPGNYSVEVTDVNNCLSATSNILQVDEPSELVVNTATSSDITCNGANDGTISVTANGGTAPYQFTLNPGSISNSTGNFSNLGQGDYTVSITDANLCGPVVTGTLTINEPDALSISVQSTQDVSCSGAGDGEIIVTGSGGNAPLSYTLDPGSITNSTGTFSSLDGGTYTVTLNDDNGCPSAVTGPIDIIDPDPVTVTDQSKTDISCNGAADGTITVTATGGTGLLTYTLNPGAVSNTTGSFTNLGPGIYTVDVEDENACPTASTTPVEIIEPSALVIDTENSTDITCNGDNDGTVSVSASGGTPPYSYTLLPGGTVNSTGVFNNLSAGNYTVEVTDASLCPGVTSNSLTVNEPDPVTITTESSQDVSCSGAGDGAIQVTATGGTAPLSYTLNPGSVTQPTGDFSSLDGGDYTVTVNDANGCPPATSGTLTIIDPDPISITDQAKTDISCNGATDGTITVNAAGGTGQLTYTLNPGAVSNTSGSFTGLGPGIYTVDVNDENGCPTASTPSIEIIEPDAIGAVVQGSSILTLDCAGDSDGIINITITGGTPPFDISWTGPSGFSSPDEDISGLVAGTYTLTITDVNSCALATPLEVEITEPDPVTMSLSATDVVCFGDADGTITVTASGGTPSYEYSRNGISYQGSNIFTGLTQNNYRIYVRDANNCITSDTISIDEPQELSVASEIRIDNNECFGDSLGEIRILEVEGGVEPYLYSINGGADFSTNSNFQNLPAGSYQTIVQDANGCTANGNLNVINQPAEIKIINYTQVDVTDCFGNNNGQIFIEATGGSGTKEYSLDGGIPEGSGIFNTVSGGDHLISIIDENNCTKDTTVTLSQPDEIIFTSITITDITTCAGDASGAVDFAAAGGAGSFRYAINGGAFGGTASFSGLTAGNHTLSVKDANDCQVDSIITITEPDSLIIETETVTDISCAGANDGQITISASGGTGTYSYILNPGGTTVNDGIFNNLGPGTYTIDVNDANGCGPVTSNDLTISEPAAINTDSVTTAEILCNGANDAEIHIYLSGGTAPYEYSIDDGANFFTFSDFTGLTPGNYIVIARDANGCTFPVGTFNFTEPPALAVVSESKTDINTCFGDSTGEIVYELDGGTGNIEYSIDNGTSWQSDPTFSNLPGGDYSVIARDENNCELTSPVFTIVEPQEITADIETTPDLDENNRGSISINNATGGTGILEFSIAGAGGPFSTDTVYTDLDTGTYPVVIRDENGCSYEEDVFVPEVIPLDVTVTITNSTCNGSDDASITMVASNATGQPEYSIDDSASWSQDGVFDPLTPGTYYIFARDEDGRYFQDTVLVGEPVQLGIFRNVTPATCSANSDDGAIDVTVNGAVGNVNFDWSNGSTSEDLDNIPSGTYWLTVTDENFCTATDTIEVPAITTVTADAGQDTAVCYGDELRLNGQGGTIFAWSPAEGLSDTTIANPFVETTEDATYVLRVEGMNECFDTDTVNVTVYPRLGLDAGNDTSVIESQSITINTTGGPYVSYNWEPATGVDDTNSANPTISILQTTTYMVSAETDQGCIDRDTITISLAERLTIYNAFSPNGDGINDYWDIDYANLYPDITVEVFNRWGERLFSSKGYSDDKRWDGSFNGTDVPVGTYYYVVVPYPGASALTGPITIVR